VLHVTQSADGNGCAIRVTGTADQVSYQMQYLPVSG
jgi:hypothetical protein